LLAADLFIINGYVDTSSAPDDDRVADWNTPRLFTGFAYEQLKAWH
jgi:hypothetical protein